MAARGPTISLRPNFPLRGVFVDARMRDGLSLEARAFRIAKKRLDDSALAAGVFGLRGSEL